jgi:hypothetical protein
MRRHLVLVVAVAMAFSIVVCQDYVYISDEESLIGIQGRLWVNPNPIRFPVVEPEEILFTVVAILSNIGSEGVVVESIDYWGDGNIGFSDKHLVDSLCPIEFPGFKECDRVLSAPGTITYVPRKGFNTGGTIVIQTNDLTSPTFEVPIILDPEVVIPDQNPGETFVTCPIVKPNPIRFKQTMAGRTQTQDVCVRFEGGGTNGKITKLEVHGKDYYIKQATDHLGNSIFLPVDGYIVGQDSITVRIASYPFASKGQGGTLLVQTVDDLGEERTLLVPILEDL